MRRSFFRVTAALAALGVAGKAAAQNAPRAGGAGAGAGARYKVVYQLSEGIDQAVRAIGNLRNHMNGAPGTKIVVVAFGHGIEFLVEGAKDAQGRTFDAPVAALASMGVEFRVCHNSLMAFKVPEDKLLLEAKVVPAGVVEITRLQQEEGFAYIKP
ncbi:DsrE family protein [Ralstonia sp. Ralssp135]|uniref:DsrE family protein n=1 Tax=Ralstonia sp. Ralssp135 TaxID=3243016 RepID=UPI0039B0E497